MLQAQKNQAKGHKTCPICGKTFKRQYYYHKHLHTHEEIRNKVQKCKFCPAIFYINSDYLDHIETKHRNTKRNRYMCSDCGKQYKTKTELNQHTNSKCGTLKQYTCKECGVELMSSGSLYNHMLRHNGTPTFMCRFCAKLFFTGGQLKVHERIHTQEKAYVCEVCNKGFCHRQSLITHSTLHTGIKPFQCENCGNSFSCIGNLIKHRKTHADSCGLLPLTTHRVKHPSTKIKVRINTPANVRLKTIEKETELQKAVEIIKNALSSDLVYTSSSEIPSSEPILDDFTSEERREEMQSENNNSPEAESEIEGEVDQAADSDSASSDSETSEAIPETRAKRRVRFVRNPKFEEDLELFIKETNFDMEGFGDCKKCGKRYMNARWLYKHIKSHEKTPEKDPLHKCSCCKMSFTTKEETLEHQLSEHAEILMCQECDKMFANRDSLRSHQKVFHKGIIRKAYLYICEKCGKQFKQKLYLKTHEERNCVDGPFYPCEICKKEFASKHTRNNHMRIHDPDKKLLCKYCAKGFHWKGQLKIHERSHTGEKPFACLYCPKAFAYRVSLITHSTIHTGIKPHLCDSCGSRFSCVGNLIKHRSSHASECGAWVYRTQKVDDK